MFVITSFWVSHSGFLHLHIKHSSILRPAKMQKCKNDSLQYFLSALSTEKVKKSEKDVYRLRSILL